MDILTERPKSHLAKFVNLYKEFGIECKIIERDPTMRLLFHNRNLTKGSYIIVLGDSYYDDDDDITTCPDKIDGYSGFHSTIVFDKDGEFLGQGFWE